MLAAAFAAAAAASYFQSAWLGLLLANLCPLAFALVHGYAAINQRGNQVVSGVAINMLAAGLAVVLGNTWFKEGGRTPALPVNARFMPIELPGARALAGVPLLGDLAKIISGHSILTYLTILLVPLTAWALAKTRFGLRLRAVGENPQAVDTAGISVALLRYQAVIIAGILCGIAGAFISTSLSASFRARHDGGPWLHGPRRPDLRQLAGLASALCLSAVWFPAGRRQLHARRPYRQL